MPPWCSGISRSLPLNRSRRSVSVERLRRPWGGPGPEPCETAAPGGERSPHALRNTVARRAVAGRARRRPGQDGTSAPQTGLVVSARGVDRLRRGEGQRRRGPGLRPDVRPQARPGRPDPYYLTVMRNDVLIIDIDFKK